jgi:uncharacterized membrane protein YfcA
VYGLGFSPKEAIAMSLAVVAVTSAFGVAHHWRAGTVNIPVAIVFGAVAMMGTLFGVRVARFVPETTQLLIFAAVMLTAAVFMLRGRHSDGEQTSQTVIERPVVSALKVVPAGLLVGTLTGIVGVGGGFLIVPALVLMQMSIREAVGTSLLVITGTCIVGSVGYRSCAAELVRDCLRGHRHAPRNMLGACLHQFVPQGALRRGFAAFLVVMAAFIFIENLGPLSAVSRRQRHPAE